jgi:hypothetical protein
MPHPKTFSTANAGDEAYELVGIDQVKIYRFGDNNVSVDWLSRARQAAGGNYAKPDGPKLNEWALLQSSFGSKSTAVGAGPNPFLSVATSYESLFRNGESWVQKIITGTPNLAVFTVPFTVVYRPSVTKLVSKTETEWLYLDDDHDLKHYLTEMRVNPYLIARV